MEIKEFIEKLAEAIEVENSNDLSEKTEFKKLEEWSSISVMLIVAFFNEEFDKEISENEIRTAETIQDLYKIAMK